MKRSSKPLLVVIAGPTGSGKTSLAIEVAEYFESVIISADSRQFYKGMPVGTAQPTADQLERIKHYFIADREVTQEYSAGRYAADALHLLETLFETYNIVVAVGGSGLYIEALCSGLDEIPEGSGETRRQLGQIYKEQGIEPLLEELKSTDPDHYHMVDRSNPQRIIRALEVIRSIGLPYSAFRRGKMKDRDFDTVLIGTSVPRDVLYRKINSRVDMMIEQGLEDEVRRMVPFRSLNALQTVGYREMFGYFDGDHDLSQAVELIKRNTRRYAKRQMTWFRRYEEMAWFDPDDPQAVINYIVSKM